MKISTILKLMNNDFKSLCKKINKYGNLNYHIRNGQEMSFSGRNGESRKAQFLNSIAGCDFKLPVKLIDYLISDSVHDKYFPLLSCAYYIRVELASRNDLLKRHIEYLAKLRYSSSAYVLRNLAKNPIVDEQILRDNLLGWLRYDYSHGAAGDAINRINFTDAEIYKTYNQFISDDTVSNESVDMLFIKCKKTPKDLIAQISKSDFFHTQCSLARDIRTPIEVLENYLNDKDRWIYEAAEKTLLKIKQEIETI